MSCALQRKWEHQILAMKLLLYHLHVRGFKNFSLLCLFVFYSNTYVMSLSKTYLMCIDVLVSMSVYHGHEVATEVRRGHWIT